MPRETSGRERERGQQPWTDLPTCPECNTPSAQPVPYTQGGTPDGLDLLCMACGHCFLGTEAQMAQARRADEAWEKHEQEEEEAEQHKARTERDRQRLEHIQKTGRWW